MGAYDPVPDRGRAVNRSSEEPSSSPMDPMFDEEDLSNPNYRCKHGTFIGNPYGADYMCGWCESGQ